MRHSPYASIFQGIEALAGAQESKAEFDMADLPDADPEDLEALDRMWEDVPVTFGPDSPGGSCPAAREALAQMDPRASAERDLSDDRVTQLGGSSS